MTMCTKCKKRPAVVFVTRIEGDKSTPEGYCLQCASELGIKPLDDMLKQFNIPAEDLEAMSEQLAQTMGGMGMINPEDEDGDFSHGGAPSFPFLNELFGAKSEQNGEGDTAKENKDDKDKKHQKKRKYLSAYCTDLTARAREGALDRIIGRDRELARVVQILSRRSKNNPCLIGEPGVGKTAIAEGLALRITAGEVPAALLGKEIHLLDLTALVAGTQFRGQFESRVKGLIEEVRREGNIILFIDEVHNMVGAGDSEGAMNAANILKPALSRGEIQVIGATTFKEYRKYIEKDAALERRFQPVTVEEPSVDDATGILLGVKSYYEQFHRVSVSDDIVRKAVTLAERYISDRFLPDKAIDLLDESCANCSLRNKAADELYVIDGKLQALAADEAVVESSDEVDYERLANIRAEKAKLTEQAEQLRPTVQPNVVTDDDLAAVIEMWTGIPAAKVKESSLKKLLDLEAAIKSKIIGQDRAVDEVVAAVRRSRVQVSPRRRPASFIFVGPTGVGKTELVKVLAAELFDTPETLIRLDMSEFMEKHSVSRIIGAPPGYVGYDEAGQLTEKVRRKPYSVLLFDEIEKAHPDVLNVLLQILDDGRITDAQGRTVNFENTVIVMTSNAGSEQKGGSLGFAKSQGDLTREKVMAALEQFLRPEFIGRVDEIIIFNSLGYDQLRQIARLMLDELVPVMKEKGITLRYTDAVCDLLAGEAGNAPRGARELRRLVRKQVEDRIATLLVERCDETVTAIAFDVADGQINVSIL